MTALPFALLFYQWLVNFLLRSAVECDSCSRSTTPTKSYKPASCQELSMGFDRLLLLSGICCYS